MQIRALPFFLLASLLLQETHSIAQANTTLSNLSNPTNINTALTPNFNAVQNLGSSIRGWRRLYLSSNGLLYLGDTRILHGNYSLYNFSIGHLAGNTAQTGTRNLAVGISALASNADGFSNVAAGYNSLAISVSADRNTAYGTETGRYNTTGNDGTFIGYRAGFNNGSGQGATLVGAYAGYNSVGHSTSAFGYRALYSASGINFNSVFGAYAAYSTTSGTNSVFGYEALRQTTSGSNNSVFGRGAMYSNLTGDMNVAMGNSAGQSSKGDYNVFIGSLAGSSITGSKNTMLGYHAGGFAFDVTNSTAVGHYAITSASNQVRIGDLNVTSIGGYRAWSNISDGRFKKDIKENVPGLEFINMLRPVTYVLDVNGLDQHMRKISAKGDQSDWPELTQNKTTVISGFIAQEVEKAATSLKFEFDGVDKPKNDNDLYALRYSEFVVPLVKAVQELSRKVDEKDSVIAEMQKIINQIAARDGLNEPFRTKGAVAQNYPNPARESTVIAYELPQNAPSSHILITDAAGRELKRIRLTNGERGNIQVNTSTLAAGIYNYSLVIEGKITSSRKMTIVR